MYRLIKKIVYLFTFYCCLDFLFFDFPVPAVSFPDAVVFFDVFLQFFYFFWKQGNETGFSEIGLRKNSPISFKKTFGTPYPATDYPIRNSNRFGLSLRYS